MTYTSTVTSKGTITLPASIRKKLGITPGKVVDIQLRGNTVSVTPQSDWDDFFVAIEGFGEKARGMIARGEAKALLTSADIAEAAAKGRAKERAKSRH